jgi:4,5-DOPA dioxygenase extradiol
MTVMPAAFIGHGNPMNALEKNRYTEAWRAFGEAVPRPRAILVVSAHWYVHATALTAMPRPRTIHDFFGFPRELFDVRYEPPGLPSLYEEVADIAHPTWVGADLDSWGIDHGAWSVLLHAFPDADIPVVQLSINALKSFDYHLQLGAALAPLREDGVLVIASGNVVHNLGGVSRALPDAGFDWAQRFDESAKDFMLTDPADIGRLDGHRDFDLAVPTPDHFLPLLYLAGMAGATGTSADVLVDGYSYGSLSMTAYTVGMSRLRTDGAGFAAPLPDGPPADGANI